MLSTPFESKENRNGKEEKEKDEEYLRDECSEDEIIESPFIDESQEKNIAKDSCLPSSSLTQKGRKKGATKYMKGDIFALQSKSSFPFKSKIGRN